MNLEKVVVTIKRFIFLSIALFTVLSGGSYASATGTGTFEVGGFWQPPIYVGADYNTNTNWANIAAANIDVMTGVRMWAGTMNKAANETGIANSYANNVKLQVSDDDITGKLVYTAADIAALQTALTPYKNDSRVTGIHIVDEPTAFQMEGFANAYKQAKVFAPNMDYYVNMLPNVTDERVQAPYGKLFLSNSGAQGSGSTITSTHSLGQTIMIPAGTQYLDGVDLYIDATQWSSSEMLILRLWDSPAKSLLLSEALALGTGNNKDPDYYHYFQLSKAVTPLSTYYLELVHTGGGDNSIGGISRSSTNVYTGGAAYENGVSQSYDFFFRLYTTRDNQGSNYENYLDDWIQYSGANYILYDSYNFLYGSSDNPSYFQNAELVRSRGLFHDVLYGGFLQSLDGDTRTVTMDMMRWNVYTLLTYGAKKLNWYTYWRPDPSVSFNGTAVDDNGTLLPRYTQIQTLNSEMRKLGGTLKDLTSLRVYHTGTTIPMGTKSLPPNFFVKPADLTQPVMIGYFKNTSGRKYVMLTNRDYTASKTVSFNFSPNPASITEISKTTGLEVSASGYNSTTGILNITLSPGEGRLFAMPSGFSPNLNLAAEATVTASSSLESSNTGWGKQLVNDDQRNTVAGALGWQSNSNVAANHTESITVDLGNATTVGEVDLFQRNDAGNVGTGFPIDFTIKVATSSSGPWTTVVTKTGYPLTGNVSQWFAFTPLTARYVKFEATNLRVNAGEYRLQLSEFEVYAASNYAKGSLVTSTSSVENSNWGVAKAADLTRNSVSGLMGWSSNSNTGTNHTEAISFDMQQTRTISEVDLYPVNNNGNVGSGFPIDFTVQVAANSGGPWTTVVTRSGYVLPPGLVQSFTFAAQTARYVKVEGTSLRQITTESGLPYRMQFAEVEIH
ncbi:hypothetical protein Back11_55690 [Paenibacillus baekrokdamisoli]|uniref:Uncharacterized protein n=1 Tax=Paenibacillus baekrokdamisoli TaxID=1712516 RepID=A0A3G9JMY5_9BACL|nr:discoidin domain-containing protein [Paenibacillus baekrokdamisoli]MBB3071794.1 hypothetical protein [Paenibacillus baekrokdamisoli]BBH24224.1 hypothetical protein Back11_55690 [Paenibacillus baekrokdamisoli]